MSASDRPPDVVSPNRDLPPARKNQWSFDVQRELWDAYLAGESGLLHAATGTGKTLTLVNEVYRLMKSGLARRVLFLVDRRALARNPAGQEASGAGPRPDRDDGQRPPRRDSPRRA